jgi:hypothetical protein
MQLKQSGLMVGLYLIACIPPFPHEMVMDENDDRVSSLSLATANNHPTCNMKTQQKCVHTLEIASWNRG